MNPHPLEGTMIPYQKLHWMNRKNKYFVTGLSHSKDTVSGAFFLDRGKSCKELF